MIAMKNPFLAICPYGDYCWAKDEPLGACATKEACAEKLYTHFRFDHGCLQVKVSQEEELKIIRAGVYRRYKREDGEIVEAPVYPDACNTALLPRHPPNGWAANIPPKPRRGCLRNNLDDALNRLKKARAAKKAMQAATKGRALTTWGAYRSVAKSTGLKANDVKRVIECIMVLAADQIKEVGYFKFANMLKLKCKVKKAKKADKGVNPFTKEPWEFKSKPASNTVMAMPMKKFKEMVN